MQKRTGSTHWWWESTAPRYWCLFRLEFLALVLVHSLPHPRSAVLLLPPNLPEWMNCLKRAPVPRKLQHSTISLDDVYQIFNTITYAQVLEQFLFESALRPVVQRIVKVVAHASTQT